jgi:hypothetical protein
MTYTVPLARKGDSRGDNQFDHPTTHQLTQAYTPKFPIEERNTRRGKLSMRLKSTLPPELAALFDPDNLPDDLKPDRRGYINPPQEDAQTNFLERMNWSIKRKSKKWQRPRQFPLPGERQGGPVPLRPKGEDCI